MSEKWVVEKQLIDALAVLKESGVIPCELQPTLHIDRTKDKSHGDFACNIALILAKPLAKAPRVLAQLIVDALSANENILRVEIAGPGFINFFMHPDYHAKIIQRIVMEKETFGFSKIGAGIRVLMEYVSSNPTGPLHVGHGRSAAFGASLANLLEAAGFDVTREYYVNDAGRQMDILAVSVWLRYLALQGQTIVFPANAYRGEYVIDIARHLSKEIDVVEYVKDWAKISSDLPLDEPEGGDKELYIDALIAKAKALLTMEHFLRIHRYALDCVLKDIREDLAEFSVTFDDFFSERALLDDGSIERGIEALKAAGYTEVREGALWFNATALGDEKDRVLVRANGQPTYFACDVAYHWNKYNRHYDRVIDIFGADHHGYEPRIRAAVRALGKDEKALEVLFVQFAILYRGDTRVQMSTRSGSFVTLRELRDEVGNDAARFFYVMRKPEQHMDFDLELAKSQSNDNPVYYIQYAHARISSVLRQLEVRGLDANDAVGLQSLNLLNMPQEEALIQLLNQYPELIESAAMVHEPHQIAYYLRELATGLHSYYNAVVLLCENTELRTARLCLLKAVRQVIRNGLFLLGVNAPESM